METEVASEKKYTQEPFSEQPSEKPSIDTSNDLFIQEKQRILSKWHKPYLS
jgi:hypothetical protein